ncbi:hypothetical protein K438DRAFT_1595824 [Mycena galopus ATCC 62051]|nr:hypothetical protein K438DRAFT_1595824 [Mycena galopus ATCC 62051]
MDPATLAAAAAVGLVILQATLKFFKPRVSHKPLTSLPNLYTPQSALEAIPSVGVPSYPFGFYVGAWNYIKNGRAITEEGFNKYRGKAFKVAFANRWLVLLNGRALIDDIKKAPDEFLSMSRPRTR